MTLRSIHSEEHLVSKAEIAVIVGCSEDSIDKMREQGMPSIKWGRRLVRFRPSKVLAWLEDQQEAA